MKINLHNFEREEIIDWFLTNNIPQRFNNRNLIRSFKKRVESFYYCQTTRQLKFKLGIDSFFHIRRSDI